jgi:serine/threonine protein kinase
MPMMKAGHVVGRYRLLVPIGAGGMAQVWAARPESAGLARTVAIKLVLPDYAADGEYERMFVRNYNCLKVSVENKKK